jgi:signal transduction histidine kinase
VSDVSGWGSLRAWLVGHPRIADAVLAGAVGAVCLLLPWRGDHRPSVAPGAWSVALTALAAASLFFRRANPVVVWGLTVVIGAVGAGSAEGPPITVVPSFVALYTLASRLPLSRTAFAATATAGAPLVASLLADRWVGELAYGVLGWSGTAAAIGAVVRSQRAIIAAAEERAERAERTREEEAQRRVADERLRIARELHDVVAHHISVINVQAGVVRHLMDTDPEQARAAIVLVRESSRAVLSELSAILGLLRTNEDLNPTQPAPSLGQAEELVASMRHAGMEAVWRLTGQPTPLPPLIDLIAYRIIQESLTNAAKHGNGDAEVSIEYEPRVVRIVVSNSTKPVGTARPGRGHGVIGMRERVGSVGGRIELGPTRDGRFVLTAELPLELPPGEVS